MSTERRQAGILQVQNLCKVFGRGGSLFKKEERFAAVDDVSFELVPREMLGLLGESGCGKTTLARMLMHLIRPTSGSVILNGEEVQDLPEREFRKRRKTIQMVYQNPFDCLDPSRKILSQLEEPMRLWHPQMDKAARRGAILEMLTECGLPGESLKKLPREFSGGQLQRISIARALLARPQVLIADEIISALDVPIQNQILQLLFKMKEEYRLSILFITHDLSVARKMSDRVMVMREGRLRGIGAPEEVFSNQDEPYIKALGEAVFCFRSTFTVHSSCVGPDPDAVQTLLPE